MVPKIIAKSGCVQAIVVGYFGLRLAAKCAIVHATNTLTDSFSRLQLRLLVAEGCDVHEARLFNSNTLFKNIFGQLYFSMPLIVYIDISSWIESLSWFWSLRNNLTWCCHHSTFQSGKVCISSEEDPQQGDPLVVGEQYIQSYGLLRLLLRMVSWTTYHFGNLCPPCLQTLTFFVETELK